MKALIIYHSKTGHTEQAARDISRGLESEGVECVLRKASRGGEGSDLDEFGIVLFGTPTYGNRMYRLAARQVQAYIDSLPEGALEGKYCGAFAVNAGVGAKQLVAAIERNLARLGGKVVAGGPAVRAGAPLSLWKGPNASDEDVRKCQDYGRRVARAARGG